jgi:hypothetical protein
MDAVYNRDRHASCPFYESLACGSRSARRWRSLAVRLLRWEISDEVIITSSGQAASV